MFRLEKYAIFHFWDIYRVIYWFNLLTKITVWVLFSECGLHNCVTSVSTGDIEVVSFSFVIYSTMWCISRSVIIISNLRVQKKYSTGKVCFLFHFPYSRRASLWNGMSYLIGISWSIMWNSEIKHTNNWANKFLL